MRRQTVLALLVTTSIAFGLLAVGFHSHGFSSTSNLCTACTLVHASPAPVADGIEFHVPCAEQRFAPPSSVTFPDDPDLGSQASRAPPAPHRLVA